MARLIDADALKKGLEDWYCAPERCNSYNGVRCRACALDDALSGIDDAPTVDPIEWFKAWIGEIMMNNNDEPLTQSEILRRIDEGGLKRFIEDYEREKNDDTDRTDS